MSNNVKSDSVSVMAKQESADETAVDKRPAPVSAPAEEPTLKRIRVEQEPPSTTTSVAAVPAAATSVGTGTGEVNRASVPPASTVAPIVGPAAVPGSAAKVEVEEAGPGRESSGITATHQHEEEKKSSDLAMAPAAATPAATTTSTTIGAPPAAVPEAPPPPLKALKMSHLRTKYTCELEYMLREFRKLERQLLGAKGATQIEESAGSRERREKLHSFILHLEDTIRQIELGCKLEAEGKSTVNVGVGGPNGSEYGADPAAQEAAKKNRADSVALSNLTHEKDEEENVQKLEEHILANLLPVKVRLKKQLAAQQGATRNPAGMPVARRGMLQPSEAERGKGTFAAAAEQRRKEAEALAEAQEQQQMPAEPVHPDHTQFGKPLGRRGSSLTQKLHGQTLGSKGRPHGHGVGLSKPIEDGDSDSLGRKVIYGGVAPGSKQVVSGVTMASSVHNMPIDTPHVRDKIETNKEKQPLPARKTQPVPKPIPTKKSSPEKPKTSQQAKADLASSGMAEKKGSSQAKASKTATANAPSTVKAIREKMEDPSCTEEERKKLRRKLKKKLLLRRARRREFERQRQAAIQQSVQVQGAPKSVTSRKKAAPGKPNGKKRGPRTVEYICALCSEAYSSMCDCNPWWALAQHECPKCRKTQIPRVDISAPANAIEYHPALLAHADDNGGSGAAASSAAAASNAAAAGDQAASNAGVVATSAAQIPFGSLDADMLYGSDSEFGSDLSDITDGNLSDISLDSDDSDAEVLASIAPAEKAEFERFGFEYKGPLLTDSEASRLLILMLHANGCPCRHANPKHKDVCLSTKYMMLHVRDCPGTTSAFDVCPFPWCRKVKHLLFHLVSCVHPGACGICSPEDLPKGLKELAGLNQSRLKRQRAKMIETHTAAKAARQQQEKAASNPPAKPSAVPSAKKPPPQKPQSNGAVAASRAKPRVAALPPVGGAKPSTAGTNTAQKETTDNLQAPVPQSKVAPKTSPDAAKSVSSHPIANNGAPSAAASTTQPAAVATQVNPAQPQSSIAATAQINPAQPQSNSVATAQTTPTQPQSNSAATTQINATPPQSNSTAAAQINPTQTPASSAGATQINPTQPQSQSGLAVAATSNPNPQTAAKPNPASAPTVVHPPGTKPVPTADTRDSTHADVAASAPKPAPAATTGDGSSLDNENGKAEVAETSTSRAAAIKQEGELVDESSTKPTENVQKADSTKEVAKAGLPTSPPSTPAGKDGAPGADTSAINKTASSPITPDVACSKENLTKSAKEPIRSC